MTLLGICSPCQMGEHEHHHRVIQAVPKGMLGGAVCKCEGECSDGRYKSKQIQGLAEMLVRAAHRPPEGEKQ